MASLHSPLLLPLILQPSFIRLPLADHECCTAKSSTHASHVTHITWLTGTKVGGAPIFCPSHTPLFLTFDLPFHSTLPFDLPYWQHVQRAQFQPGERHADAHQDVPQVLGQGGWQVHAEPRRTEGTAHRGAGELSRGEENNPLEPTQQHIEHSHDTWHEEPRTERCPVKEIGKYILLKKKGTKGFYWNTANRWPRLPVTILDFGGLSPRKETYEKTQSVLNFWKIQHFQHFLKKKTLLFF